MYGSSEQAGATGLHNFVEAQRGPGPFMAELGERLSHIMGFLQDADVTLGALEDRLFGPSPELNASSSKVNPAAPSGAFAMTTELLDALEQRARRVASRANGLQARV